MMVVEITTGWTFHSMALLADGWHMSSHSASPRRLCTLAAICERYTLCIRDMEDRGWVALRARFYLAGVALFMALESIERLFHPVAILFDQAIVVATIGLAMNIISALLLRDDDHHHGHSQGHAHADLDLRAAYVHVIAATTSMLAIAALVGGKFLHWNWLDSAMGIVGAIVVGVWAWGLLRDTSRVLLDREMESAVVESS
jgi:cation diffusion facilitator family transporter